MRWNSKPIFKPKMSTPSCGAHMLISYLSSLRSPPLSFPLSSSPLPRGGKIGPTRWASPTRSKLGPGWAIKLLARKNRAKFGPAWYGPVRYSPARPGQPEFFFTLKRLFGPTGPVFRAGWAVKILARKNRANFGPARFWPGPLLAQPSPA